MCDNDKELAIPSQEYMGDLQLNGYYLGVVQESSGEHNHIIFLFQNGVMYNTRTSMNQVEFEQAIINRGFNEHLKYKWGRFVVNNENEIVIQGWMWDMCNKRVYTLSGTEVSDSTFVLNQHSLENESQTIQREYMFVEYHLKPDSLNSFVN